MKCRIPLQQLLRKRLMRAAVLFFTAAVLFIAMSGCSRKRGNAAVVPCVPAKDTIAIGFYNVENLFDLNYDGNEYPEYRPGALGWNKQTWEKKIANVASVIAAMDADAIGLCEVENRSALEGLLKELEHRNAAYPYSAIADISGRGATCTVLLSRFPLVWSSEFGGGNVNPGSRPVLEADVDFGGRPLKVFVNHWPSKKHPESQRLAAARTLAERIKKLSLHTEYVIIGDLNSDYDEWRKFHTEGLDDTRGATGINHLLKTVHVTAGKFVSYVTREDMAAYDSAWHYDLWLELPEGRRCSYTYQGQFKTPDHILLPHSLFDGNGWSYLKGTFSVFTWDNRLLRNGEPFRWQMKGFGKRRFHTGEGYSDHLPLRAVFIKNKAAPAADSAAVPARAGMCGEERHSSCDGGFEVSLEGWLAGSREFSLARDSGMPATGRRCLKIQAGGQPEKNCTAARIVLPRDATNRLRHETITFALRGSGKLSVRARAGKGKWRYYNAPAFTPSGSARYKQVRYGSWRRVALPFTYDNTSASDLSVEIRAGRGQAFCVWIDDVAVR
jgi:endonuclease/exonuclease/phosphatase family metal-dependent hydrolase